jgi:ankyrin repeat protein
MRNRKLDFFDCFKADVGPGIGADVQFRLTDAFSGGAGFSYVGKVGFKGRHFRGRGWADGHIGLGVADMAVTGFTDPVGVWGYYYESGSIMLVNWKVEKGRMVDDMKYPVQEGGWHIETKYFGDLVSAFDIEAGATLGVFGFRLGFSPGEFVDFALGWFGLDTAYDDLVISRMTVFDAVEKGCLDYLKTFLDEGADVNSKTEYGETLLHIASREGHKDIAQFLIEKGVDVNVRIPDIEPHYGYVAIGATPLYLAARRGHLQIAKLLISKGADVNARIGKDATGKTPLCAAAEEGYVEIAKLVIAHGADLKARDTDGNTTLHLAVKSFKKEAVELFIAKGCEVNAKNVRGETPLHFAARIYYYLNTWQSICETLIANGADVNARDNKGQTPIDVADHEIIARFLAKHGGKPAKELSEPR